MRRFAPAKSRGRTGLIGSMSRHGTFIPLITPLDQNGAVCRQSVAQLLFSISKDPNVILLIIVVFLLIIGCFMETTAILVISVPVLFPLATRLGIDPVHFGLLMVINLLIGTCTPPFGIALFITMQIAGVSFAAICRAVAPFLVPMIATLLLVTFFPQLVLFLPNLFQP